MNILLVSREFPPHIIGGVAYHASNLARAFSDLGHSVTVLTTEHSDHTADSRVFDLSGVEIVRIDCRSRVSPRLWFGRAARSYLHTEVEPGEFDLVHSHELIDMSGIDIAAPTILKTHYNLSKKVDYFRFDRYHPLVRPFIAGVLRHGIDPLEQSLVERAVESSDGHVCVSNLVREIATDAHSSARSTPTRVVYNGVDGERFHPGATITDEYFLFVGGTARRKGYDRLIDAVAGTDLELKIAGADGPVSGPVPSNIEFLGHVDQTDLRPLYQNARALVHPAMYEPFGNVVLEALACGTPVVVSTDRYCGAAEVISEAVGVRMDPTATETIREALRSFRPERYDLSDCRAVADFHTWDRVATETLEFARRVRT